MSSGNRARTGIVNEKQAEWLIERADSCASVNALAALVNVLGEAHRAPRWFLDAVRARARQLVGRRRRAFGGGLTGACVPRSVGH